VDTGDIKQLYATLSDSTIDNGLRMIAGRALALSTNEEANEIIFDFILNEGKEASYHWREVVEVMRQKNDLARIYSQAWYKSIFEPFRHLIRFSPLTELQGELRRAYFEGIAPFKPECCSVNQIRGDIVCNSDPSHGVTYLDVLKLLVAPNGGSLNISSATVHNNWMPVDYEWFRRNGFL